ncbi:NUDIX hydrolase [Ochrobactrum vermis]|uniref:NUDIX hydrolase n=1 Tax=Ochrobactrum vermis TaxID=1827297 RepID=A0ABU8PNK9_9HYPH|nr:NUDIX hydrolase [Ochrobactrum vermis]
MSSRKWKNGIRKAKAGTELEQAAALPYRFENGRLEILLLTTRNTRRFTLPKGWPMKRKSLAESARVEALEEAGLEGILAPGIIGHFFYWKRLKSVFIPVKVSVFPLFVLQELPCWREQDERYRKWLSTDEAQLLVDEPELVSLIGLLDSNRARTGSSWEICVRTDKWVVGGFY